MKNWIGSAVAVSVACLAGSVLAQEGASAPQWYDRVDGILAIPVTLIGIPLTWVMIRKTNLEARKTRLEIMEKERILAAGESVSTEAERAVLRPILRESITGTVLFRFILLYLVLQFWGIVASAYSALLAGLSMALFSAEFGREMTENSLFMVGYLVVANVPNLITWGIVIALGWPLLKDVNRYLRIVNVKA